MILTIWSYQILLHLALKIIRMQTTKQHLCRWLVIAFNMNLLENQTKCNVYILEMSNLL